MGTVKDSSGKEYAVMGATLECTMGSAPSSLIVLPIHRALIKKKFRANIGDCKPMVNVLPFATCKSPANPAVAAATAAAGGVLTEMPCTPACAIWIGGKTNTILNKLPSLMEGDTAICPLGVGTIEVTSSGQ